jgi:hypothetical protein
MTKTKNTIRILMVVAMLGAFGAAATPAHAVTVGVSDQQPGAFTNPLFKALKFKTARFITPYDVMKHPEEREKLDAWITNARKAKQKLLISFEHSRREGRHARVPSNNEFRREMTAFKKKYGSKVEAISPWNEVNVCQRNGRTEGQPPRICKSKTGPKIVAGYYKVARSVFKGKKIVGLDILDGVNVGGAVGYIKRFKKYAKPAPKYWGLHNYSDTNRGSTKRTAAMIKAIGDKKAKIWLTETGGQLKLRGVSKGEATAAKALKCMFSMPKKFKQIERLYVYHFHGARPDEEFDAGLIDINNNKRQGYDIVRKRQSATCKA